MWCFRVENTQVLQVNFHTSPLFPSRVPDHVLLPMMHCMAATCTPYKTTLQYIYPSRRDFR